MKIIHIGDGRHVELVEGATFRPPPPPIKKRCTKPKTIQTKPTKRRTKGTNEEIRGENHPVIKLIANLPGYKEWWTLRNEILGKYRRAGRRLGEGAGRGRQRAGYILGQAKTKVKKDMANIDKKFPDLDPIAYEALEGAVQVLREPNSQQTKLAAARLLLEFTKSKPVAKSEVSVNAAEIWLASLGQDDS
jgi:hypothetical protein